MNIKNFSLTPYCNVKMGKKFSRSRPGTNKKQPRGGWWNFREPERRGQEKAGVGNAASLVKRGPRRKKCHQWPQYDQRKLYAKKERKEPADTSIGKAEGVVKNQTLNKKKTVKLST